MLPLDRHQTSRAIRRLITASFVCLAGCASEPEGFEAELYPEQQQPHFKTCIARNGGTYQERKLQQYPTIDIYEEPAADQGPITEECIVRE